MEATCRLEWVKLKQLVYLRRIETACRLRWIESKLCLDLRESNGNNVSTPLIVGLCFSQQRYNCLSLAVAQMEAHTRKLRAVQNVVIEENGVLFLSSNEINRYCAITNRHIDIVPYRWTKLLLREERRISTVWCLFSKIKLRYSLWWYTILTLTVHVSVYSHTHKKQY